MTEILEQDRRAIVPGFEEINNELSGVAQSVRVFSRSQVDTWRQLPYLALQADGNNGYSSFNKKLYTYGMLQVAGKSEGLYGTYVDCESGDILSLYGELDLERVATDVQVVQAWLPEGDTFNAQKWLEKYRANAVEPHSGLAARSEQDVREWRHNLARELGLLSIFRRAEAPVL